ncbi:GNAT family N-acetyltransferase [Erythrobacter tepidarius]|uniref:GNAT family N-acetyltransferase n=1 Tax=Erythrobacter tepidarius TaxID=60454 RepID=UPI000A3C3ED0|nr:GNAT family N-acetyltransferase [Erythrobacter tepidarius]
MTKQPDTAFVAAPNPTSWLHPDRGGTALTVDFLHPAALPAAERARWARLSARAAPGNIFAQDWFMEPALRHCGEAATLRLAVVRQASGEWLGALPLVFEPKVGRCPLPSLHSWRASNQFLATPLVLPGAEKAFWTGLLARLDRRPGLALALCCKDLPLDDPATLALVSLCAEQGRMIETLARFVRPARLSGRQRLVDPRGLHRLDQRLDGLERRLGQALGPVSTVMHSPGEDCEAWIAAFLALERAGWKGRARSALACAPGNTALFREAIRHGHRIGAARLASLRAGDRIVAMSSWFVAHGHGFGFKMTYDEAWRKFAPGRLLMRQVARLSKGEAELLFDTCAPAGSPTDALWPQARTLGCFAVAIGGSARRRGLRALIEARTRWHRRRTPRTEELPEFA